MVSGELCVQGELVRDGMYNLDFDDDAVNMKLNM